MRTLGRMRGLPPKKAFPSGADSPCQGEMSRSDRGDRERWHGEAVTDEGTMIERFRSSQGDFAACGRREGFALRGEFLSQRWERNQRIAGGRLQRSTVPVLLVALPPDPIYGGYPFGLAENFRRAKSGVLECNSFRPH